ncbi:MarR family winged helix-turn-helix transcriptional regulator [Pseudomonas sp. S9]|uniref:MarR family winged helix-turn-helix transcriptional regulator n=1 Tax=Pseudomonas sp. S9 TaxID=686578 RepID=UPI0002557084|nr:MarR family winged helix-turn-helix transcriptional regulator [Pseudomonas sp. S9]
MLSTQCLCTQLRRASRGVSKLYDDALSAIGINVAQYSLLKHLQRLEQPSISNLALALGLDRSTLGRNLRVLEARDLVVMQEGADQRNRIVLLSAHGEQVIEAAFAAWQGVQQLLVERMGAEQVDELSHLLAKLQAFDSGPD